MRMEEKEHFIQDTEEIQLIRLGTEDEIALKFPTLGTYHMLTALWSTET